MSGEPNKILVVDDDSVIRELMQDILSEEGYSVEAVPDAFDALDRLREDKGFVLLFTDIMMPKMDGIELIREARRVNPTIIPIVMTGYATLESARAAVKEGAYDYVLKPFSLSEIKLAVANALTRYHLANENARLLELTELFNISESVATFHDERKLLDYVLKAALNRVGAERGSIMLMTPDGASLDVAASIGVPEEAQHDRVQVGKGISGWVAEHGKPLVVKDIGENPDLKDISRQLKDASFISLPLERKLSSDAARTEASGNGRDRVVAVLNVNRKQSGGYFTEGDLKTLSIMANHTAIALENVRLLEDVKDAHLATLKSMTLVLEAKDTYTHGHSERVRNFSAMAAIKMGMNATDVETLRLGAMLHDVGKIGLSDTILHKAEKLSNEDWEQIKLHPVIGYDVLKPIEFLTEDHLKVVRSHHERLDGSGYPDGLKGDELDDLVRIISVADTYDAMSSDRAYRRGMDSDSIVQKMKHCAGVTMDCTVTSLFIDLIQSGEIGRFALSGPQQGGF